MEYEFFISYSRKDNKIISPLLEVLNKNYISYFFDKEKIRAGEQYGLKIKNALLNTKNLIFIWTKNSDISTWANNEVFFSLTQGIPIIPIKIGKFRSEKLDFALASTNWCEVNSLDINLCEKICNVSKENLIQTDVSNWDESLYEKSKQMLSNLFPSSELINKFNKGVGEIFNNLKDIGVLGALTERMNGISSLVSPSLALMMQDLPKKSDEEIKTAIKSSNAIISFLKN